jgi:hypothetical protein
VKGVAGFLFERLAVSLVAFAAHDCKSLPTSRGDIPEVTTMTDPTTQPTKIDGYHAHVYHDAETRPRAE